MEPSCVRQNLIPGTSRLFEDFLYNFDKVAPFYGANFADPESFRQAASQINFPPDRRKAIVAALRQSNNVEDQAVAAHLDLLSLEGTFAVVTGQQVGLLSGPCYTIFKALTALKLARSLTESGLPAVPVFWLATEDHDLAEIDHAWVFDCAYRPVKVAAGDAVASGGPVGDIPVGKIDFSEFRRVCGNLPFGPEVCARVEEAYGSGATFASGFRTLLTGLLSGLGILFLDPLEPSIREVARPFLTTTAPRAAELLGALKERDRELADAGYHSQVFLDEGSSLFFLLSEGKRIPLKLKDGKLAIKDKAMSDRDIQSAGAALSPNALLRPVMQDFMLPTVSYVGGPAEIAYMAQSRVLYDRLLGRMPVIFPRNSLTLLDNRADKLLARYRLPLTDLFDHSDAVRTSISHRLVPPTLLEEFRLVESRLLEDVTNLGESLYSFDPTLESSTRKSTAKMLYQLKRLNEKTAREAMRRDERSAEEADYLINLVYPHRRLQERFYSMLPFLAKHGLDLPHRLLEFTQLTCPDHMVRSV